MIAEVGRHKGIERLAGYCAIALLGACAGDDPTAPSTTVGDGARVEAVGEVRFAELPGFEERERLLVIGRAYEDGRCGYRSRRTLRPGEHEAEHLVSFDPTSCRFVVARGTYSRPPMHSSSVAAVDTMRAISSGSPTARIDHVVGSTASSSSCVQLTNVSYAFQNTILVDPVQIQVTRDETSVSWWWDGSCVYSAAGLHTMQWFTGSNWSRFA